MSGILVLVLVGICGAAAWFQHRVSLQTAREVWSGLYPRKPLPVRRLPISLYRAARRAQMVGVSGRRRLPEVIEVRAHPDDLAPIASNLDWVAGDIKTVLLQQAKSSNWDVPAGFAVKVIADPARPVGVPRGLPRSERKVKSPDPEGNACLSQARRNASTTTRPCPPTRGAGWAEALTADLNEKATEPAGILEVQVGDRPVELVAVTAAGITIGRSHEADIQVDASGASRRHAQVTLNGITLVVADRGSLNGTRLEGDRLDRPICAGRIAVLEVGGMAITIKVKTGLFRPRHQQIEG